MNAYTVVLLKPDFLREEATDSYIAFNYAKSPREAVKLAKIEAGRACKCKIVDLALVIAFERHCDVACYGFEDS
jgi:hypothetical protein